MDLWPVAYNRNKPKRQISFQYSSFLVKGSLYQAVTSLRNDRDICIGFLACWRSSRAAADTDASCTVVHDINPKKRNFFYAPRITLLFSDHNPPTHAVTRHGRGPPIITPLANLTQPPVVTHRRICITPMLVTDLSFLFLAARVQSSSKVFCFGFGFRLYRAFLVIRAGHLNYSL